VRLLILHIVVCFSEDYDLLLMRTDFNLHALDHSVLFLNNFSQFLILVEKIGQLLALFSQFRFHTCFTNSR
jgi:hypothetical protein